MQSAYDAFDTPLILIGGDRDQTVFTKRNSNRFQAAYPASEMIYLRQVGHMLHHTQADIIVEAARRLADGEGVRAGLHDTPAQQTS
jgi:pimeloyl-ACP methyl ester carboxylesterase